MLRPSLQDIADRVALSKMTVSRALRGERHVSQAVRERVTAVAVEMGYQPDPEISKLMSHMRSSRRAASPRTLAFIWPEPRPLTGRMTSTSWAGQLLMGARSRAARLGFELAEFSLADQGMTARRLSGIMEARGIPGFILSPLMTRSRGHVSMAWEKFSSVMIGLGFARPAMHRVHHHHFLGMMTMLRQLKKLGYRRIGFYGRSTTDERMFGAWSASFLTHHPLKNAAGSELLHLRREISQSSFMTWLHKVKPDVVIDSGNTVWPWLKGLRIPEEIGYATLSWQSEFPEHSGVDQQGEVLGAAAVDLVVEQFQHNERGVPKQPKIVLTAGEWRAGRTLRRVRD
jgi:DNA-binding LacI/PurR family transcriptional regulator